MTKCRHKNVKIVEHQIERLAWEVEDGQVPDEAMVNESDILPNVYVECRDCGLLHTYHRRSKRLPKWLKVYLEEIEA